VYLLVASAMVPVFRGNKPPDIQLPGIKNTANKSAYYSTEHLLSNCASTCVTTIPYHIVEADLQSVSDFKYVS
jgi:hypothetical protein